VGRGGGQGGEGMKEGWDEGQERKGAGQRKLVDYRTARLHPTESTRKNCGIIGRKDCGRGSEQQNLKYGGGTRKKGCLFEKKRKKVLMVGKRPSREGRLELYERGLKASKGSRESRRKWKRGGGSGGKEKEPTE